MPQEQKMAKQTPTISHYKTWLNKASKWFNGSFPKVRTSPRRNSTPLSRVASAKPQRGNTNLAVRYSSRGALTTPYHPEMDALAKQEARIEICGHDRNISEHIETGPVTSWDVVEKYFDNLDTKETIFYIKTFKIEDWCCNAMLNKERLCLVIRRTVLVSSPFVGTKRSRWSLMNSSLNLNVINLSCKSASAGDALESDALQNKSLHWNRLQAANCCKKHESDAGHWHSVPCHLANGGGLHPWKVQFWLLAHARLQISGGNHLRRKQFSRLHEALSFLDQCQTHPIPKQCVKYSSIIYIVRVESIRYARPGFRLQSNILQSKSEQTSPRSKSSGNLLWGSSRHRQKPPRGHARCVRTGTGQGTFSSSSGSGTRQGFSP